MKVALVLPAEPEMAPYIYYYINVFEEEQVDYDVIAWNRSGNNPKLMKNMVIYDQKSPDTSSKIKKISGYYRFVRFAKKKLEETEYNLIVVHTILPAVLMKSFLKKKYAKRYVLDIRDRGSWFFLWKSRLRSLLTSSGMNVISSPGFKKWLPNASYYLSHNIGLNGVKGMMLNEPIKFGKKITILSIGQIRFFEANRYVIDSLANKEKYYLHYAGYGPDSERLKEYCCRYGIFNVHFSGRYLKKDEPQILSACDFINIVFPKTSGTLSAMPNRFYGAAIFRKPVIVSSGSVQAEYVKKYGIGIVLDEAIDLSQQIETFISGFDEKQFIQGCDAFLQEVDNDNECFEKQLYTLIKR